MSWSLILYIYMAVVTGHMVYFSAYTRSEIFLKNSRELGVGCESLRHTHVFCAKTYTNFKFESEQAEQVHFIL